MLKDYKVEKRYLVAGEGWKKDTLILEGVTIEEAWEVASGTARWLDQEYGDSHFWTVDLKNPEGGSYVQLFHGRLK